MTHWDLTFTLPSHPLSANDAKGRHWAHVQGHLRPWQMAAWATAQNHRRQATRGRRKMVQVPITVQVVIPFREKRRRDPHNYTSTVVKAVVDGLVRAQIVPDDNPDWVTVLEPELAVQPTPATLTATVRIRPRETP